MRCAQPAVQQGHCARRRVSERNRCTAAALGAEIDTRPTLSGARTRHLPQRGKAFPPQHNKKSAGTFVPALFPLVRKMGLEPTRHRHTHLKRACLPIPALPHSIDCKVDSTTPRVQKSSTFCKICTARGGCPKKVIQTSKNVLLHFLPALL